MANFSEEDLKSYDDMAGVLLRASLPSLEIKEVGKTNRALSWFVQLRAKIEANIFEVKKITHVDGVAEESPEPKGKGKAKGKK